jgi:hypothetical protein
MLEAQQVSQGRVARSSVQGIAVAHQRAAKSTAVATVSDITAQRPSQELAFTTARGTTATVATTLGRSTVAEHEATISAQRKAMPSSLAVCTLLFLAAEAHAREGRVKEAVEAFLQVCAMC